MSDKPVSIRSAAQQLGVSRSALQEAIKTGRIASVVYENGHPKILDVESARRELAANSHAQGPAPFAVRDAEQPAELGDGEPFAEARRRKEIALADMRELELAERRGQLVPAADVTAQVADAFTEVRTKLLGIPSKCRSRAPHLTLADVALFEELIRESLERLAAPQD